MAAAAEVPYWFTVCPPDPACPELAIMTSMDNTTQARIRWFHLTPGRVVIALLAVEALLWLSDRFQWPTWHKGYAVLIAVASVAVVFVVMLLWFVVALVCRGRFQFSIRSLLVLTVAVAIPFSWLAVEMNAAREQKEAVKAIKKDAWVPYEYQLGALLPNPQPPEPLWLRSLLGDDFFESVAFVHFFSQTLVTDAVMVQLKGLAQVNLDLQRTEITDAGLEHLNGLKQLRFLNLTDTHVTDAGVAKLQQALPNCKIER